MKSNFSELSKRDCLLIHIHISKATSGRPYQIYMDLSRSWYGCTPIISSSPQHILIPCKVFETDTDIYFDIYQLCADKHVMTSIFVLALANVLVIVRSHEDTI